MAISFNRYSRGSRPALPESLGDFLDYELLKVEQTFDSVETNLETLDDTRNDLEAFTVATLPAATTAGQMIYVSDESGGAIPAFSDGTNWRRVTDRAVVS